MGKYDKYFIFESAASPTHPKEGFPWIPLVRIDDRVLPEAFYFECIWTTGPIPMEKAYKPHRHDADEFVGFIGTDFDNPAELCAEIEFYFDDEKHVFTKNCVVFIPAGIWHNPVIVNKLERPVFCFSTSPAVKYTQEVNRDPRWDHLEDPPEGKQ
jgi:hypothetical protein